MRNSTDLRSEAVASFVRGEIAKALRTRRPYTVNLLLGGFDPITEKPSLYWIDYLAALAKVPYAAHGYAQYYCLSILDKHHQPDIDLDKGMKILRMCTDELKRRLPIDFKGVVVKIITKDGIREEEYPDDKPVLPA
jgi:20S proteasome subunit beta 4